jgi:putative hemolysin
MIEDLFNLLLFIICILLSAFFSSSEVALISITKARVRTLVNDNKPGALALATLKENPDHFLITILIGNTIMNIAAAAIATAIAISVFGSIGVGIATGFVVIVLLIFGEIGPKIYASRAPDTFPRAVAPIILFLSRLLSPVIWVVERVSPSLGIGRDAAEPAVTEDEIKEWIDVGKEEGTIEQDEKEMLYSVLEFGDTTAREIMTPRVDVILMEDTAGIGEAIRIFNETGFSRIPIYHDQIDNITGVLNVKDVFSAMVSKRKDLSIKEIMYDPTFVPETKKIDDLLKELQVHRVQIAIVIDEYSSFVGIVTVEDILEELVGDIMDEYDKDEPDVQ